MSGTYSTARFAFYEFSKETLLDRERKLKKNSNINDLPFYKKILIAGLGGAVGAAVGTGKIYSICSTTNLIFFYFLK